MAGQFLHKIKNQVDEFFPVKTFVLCFAFLMLALFCFIGIHQAFFSKPDESKNLSGKVLAELQIEDIKPEEPVIEPPKPKPIEEKTVNEEAPPHEKMPEPLPNPHDQTTTETLEKSELVEPPPVTPDSIPNPHDQSPTETMAMEDSIAGLSEETSFGSLPIVRTSDGLKSFDAYKTPFISNATSKAVISLVMVDFGLSDTISKSMIDNLPSKITFVASPYAIDLQSKISAARAKAFEIWMDLPMQGDNPNIGPNTILAGLNTKENMFRLNTNLGKATGYAGVVVDARLKFEPNSPDLQILTSSISARGLGIAQLNPNDTLIESSASVANAPFVQSKMWIDDTLTKESILSALTDVEKNALEHGLTVAAFHPSVLTASVIQEWKETLATKNIQLAPLTYSTKINLPAPTQTVIPNEPK